MLEGSREVEGAWEGAGMVVDLGVGPVSRWGKGDPPRINTAAGRPPPVCLADALVVFPLKNRMPFGACLVLGGKKRKEKIIPRESSAPFSLSLSLSVSPSRAKIRMKSKFACTGKFDFPYGLTIFTGRELFAFF